ncbi:argonaute-like protein [Crassisporium funariophilum]|nr:argonaute-like protein [Crassisporium funariophilum]
MHFQSPYLTGLYTIMTVIINPDKLPARVNMELFNVLQTSVATQVFSGPAAYDGRKNAFSMYKLPLGPTDSGQFDVTLRQTGPPAPAGSRPPKIYKIKLTMVAEINTEILGRFIRGQQSQDNAVLTAIMALNVVIRMGPNQRFPFNSRSFFTPQGKRNIGGGLELWRGYFQSIRPSQNRMYVNIDISTGIMYKSGPLIALCLEFMGKNNPAALSHTTNLPDRERLRLQKFISNMRVSTNHTGRQRVVVIKKLSIKGASATMFTMREGGNSMSVANYFKNHVNKPLKFPDVLCIETGSGAMIPLELCDVLPGQIMRKQIPADKTTDVVEFSKMAPDQRFASIKEGLQVLSYSQSEYIREFGMNVTPDPILTKSRVLPPPTLRYGVGSSELTIRPANGSWNMRSKKFFRPATIRTWAIVIYESPGRFREDVVREMANAFVENAQAVGMTVTDKTPLYFWENGQGNISAQLSKAGKACVDAGKGGPNLIVVVLPEGGNDIYTAVKHFGDVTMGVATQCLKSNKCSRAKPQYWANVMLKVNVKLDGINSILDNSPLNNDPNNPTIVMGADVIHPAPGAEGRPSFTCLVSSVDSTTAKYVAISRVQTGRQEIIDDLEEMCAAAFNKYRGYQAGVEKRKIPPTRLIFYRDGVSEGQFQQVLDQELPMIKNACVAAGIKPKITLIIVGKRHHIRMCTQNKGDADRSGNAQAGTTIDEGLGHPTEFDYYQLTHGGLLGTSRPAHYSVLYDDNKFSADAMQGLSFALTHVYARATRSVSIPAPVYYADIVCARAKNHYAPGIDLSESATQSSSQAGNQLEAYKQGYLPLNPKQSGLMYFM